MFEKGLIKKEENMFQEEKRKTNYGAMCLVCFFCCFFAFQFMKLVITQPSIATSSISVIDSPISADKLSDRRELWRVSQPSTYCLKIESFTKLATSPNVEKYKTRPFQSGGYNWTFIVYHKGNVKDGAPADWVSMYVQIDNSALFNSPKEVYAEVKFFIYNRKEDKYFTVSRQMQNAFFLSKPYWGYGNVRSYGEVANPDAGWLFDGDSVLFGVDIFVTEVFNKMEVFSFTKNLHNRLLKWTISNFSSLEQNVYLSNMLLIGGRSWALKMYPRGDGEGQGNSLSVYVIAPDFKPYERVYLKAKVRIINQKYSKDMETNVESWSDQASSWGFQRFVSFADLQDTSKGLLVNDTLKLEVEFEDLSNTKYFPS
ncbi:PREDICTED: probable inactive serine/threonine-protein kinase fnkC isoform X2 [Camelina sativa]|uniref:Probable inactive serine/threonine-protein kinase fnkC isoform X2 n=1 Tax=Camelina sativa TaxID=90675 RepID=A0ABM0TFD8_CAMSA|nr:PREDICTED: probable inactive serine/threonine-protein kinase fnkC isoform X2 [Camelina sativa]